MAFDSIEGSPLRPENFAATVEQFASRKGTGNYFSSLAELEDMAQGGKAGGLRDQFYVGWQNADFIELLEQPGESVEEETLVAPFMTADFRERFVGMVHSPIFESWHAEHVELLLRYLMQECHSAHSILHTLLRPLEDAFRTYARSLGGVSPEAKMQISPQDVLSPALAWLRLNYELGLITTEQVQQVNLEVLTKAMLDHLALWLDPETNYSFHNYDAFWGRFLTIFENLCSPQALYVHLAENKKSILASSEDKEYIPSMARLIRW